MKIRSLIIVAIIWTIMPCWAWGDQSDARLPVVRIGIVMDGPKIRFPYHLPQIKEEIQILTRGQFDVQFPVDKTIVGNWTRAGVKQAVDRLLKDAETDLVITLGLGASHYAAQLKQFSKPLIAAVVASAQLQGFPLKGNASGIKNFTYIAPTRERGRDLRVFREIIPFENMTILVDQALAPTIPGIKKLVQEVLEGESVNIHFVEVGTSARNALESLPPETDALFVTPLVGLTPEEFQKLVDGLIARKLPSFSFAGRSEVEQGLLVSAFRESNIFQFARRIALNVQRILLGEDAGGLNVAFHLGYQLTINMDTARAIGVSPTWKILSEAELLNEEPEKIVRQLSIEKAVQEAIAANLDLAVQAKRVTAGEQAVWQARSKLLPQADLGISGVIIDDDRAQAAGGTQPERTFTGSARASQLLYSEDAWSNFQVERHLQTSREEEKETLRLDIILEAAVAYLDVLRAKTLLRIEKDNLKLTRANLERAQARVSAGVASMAEVFRWESEIAKSRQAVLTAQARRRQTVNTLNRLLHRPLEEQFITEDTTLTDPLLLISDQRFFSYIDNPRSFREFHNFLVKQGLETSPEIRRFDAEIEAQERILLSARRAYWLPTFSIQGDVSEVIADDGKGTRDQSIAELDDTDWSVGIYGSFPLFSGGNKSYTTQRSVEELKALRTQRQATAERIEEQIRSALHRASASYPSIQLSRDAADASQKNLKLVTDSYVQGVLSIIDLLDAQNASLVSEQSAENSVYDFLVDLMQIQRASGQFDFFMTVEEREDWFQNLETHFQKAGIELKRR